MHWIHALYAALLSALVVGLHCWHKANPADAAERAEQRLEQYGVALDVRVPEAIVPALDPRADADAGPAAIDRPVEAG